MSNIFNQGQKANGFGCPVCHKFIPTSVVELVTSPAVTCPSCGLKLTIDRNESRRAMEILEKVMEG